MRNSKILAAFALCLLLTLAVGAQNERISSGYKIEPLPRDLEIQLALSALPPHLKDNATV